MTWKKIGIYWGLPLAFALSPHAVLAQGQFGNSATIRANIKPGGGDGKCTFEVEVDEVAEVEVRGDTGLLRTISGSPATWRRLDCNGPMPANPANFRFKGIDGRGRQTLVRDPGGNGSAVVRIEDPKPGREGFTGDLMWKGGSYTPTNNGNYGNGNYGNWNDRGNNNNDRGNNNGNWNNSGNNNGNWNGGNGNNSGNWNSGGWNRGGTGGWNNNGQNISSGDAMNICQNEVASQSGANRDDVRVRGGGDNDNRGSYTVNFQIRSRNNGGNGTTGSCRISRTGQIEDIRH